MKFALVAAALLASLSMPAWAKNFAFPKNNPAAVVTIPDTWSTEAIDYGFSAKSPDGDVYFSVESSPAKSMDKMLDLNTAWMKENKITVTGPAQEQDVDLGGLKAKAVNYPAKDENGETGISLLFAQAGDRLIFITLWASEEEVKANQADLKAIRQSIKAIQ